MGKARSGIYGLTDETRQATCYVGRAFDIDHRYRQHIGAGQRRLRWALYDGWLDRPIMCGRENWLAYMMLAGREIGLVLLEEVAQDQSQQHDREIAWARKLTKEGVPLANGRRASAHLGMWLEKVECPYTPHLPVATLEDIPRPKIMHRWPQTREIVPVSGITG